MKANHPPKVVIIGAGLGGLATAVRLLAAGCDVTVIEAQASTGGRAGRLREAGFTFDTGPTLITLPELIDELFRLGGSSLSQELAMHALDPFYRIAWEDDSRIFRFSGDREAMREEIAKFSSRDAGQLGAFLKASAAIYSETILKAAHRSFLHLTDFLEVVPAMVRLGAIGSTDGFVGHFFKEPHVRQAFSFHPLFIGGDPFRVPAVYSAVAFMEMSGGVWYPEGGIYSLVEALERLVRKGGRIITGDPAFRIVDRGRRAVGVVTESGGFYPADAVISNADVVTTYRRLLGDRSRPAPRLSMSCFQLYLGTRRAFPELTHHTLFVGREYQRFMHDVTDARRLPRTLSLYVDAPSRTEPAMAPAGGESIMALLPVPNLAGDGHWPEVEAELRGRVIQTLETYPTIGLSGLGDSIVVERHQTPLDFRDYLRSAQGNGFGPEPTLFQSTYFRQHNRDQKIRRLYYAGAGTHPGAGIPGVLLGAEVTAGLVLEDVTRNAASAVGSRWS
jgi:phytoene desaturase